MRFCWHINGIICPACEDQLSGFINPKKIPRYEPVDYYATNKDLEDLRREVVEIKRLMQEVLKKLK